MLSLMDDPAVDHFIITTNAIVKRNGALVMGAGIAKRVRDNNPGVDVLAGQAVERLRPPGSGRYGLILNVKGQLGLFQVKRHYKDTADINLIRYSTMMLHSHAVSNPETTYALNFPGIGNGRLSIAEVSPCIDYLPNNVQVWTF
jgi:hypothetical protein